MWILECDGDFLQGKRLWLKPGQRYLFGRVKKDGVRFLIEHKSISRKHFVIEVNKVKEGDGAHVHTRSKVTVTDLKSKGGTQVDGKPLKDGSQVLDKVEHYLKPGSYPASLRIKWSPVVLSFSLSSKEMKTKDFLKPKRDRLEQLDIKTILEYIPASTTHVVAAKRNTAKGLQALIHGKYIVDEPYIDALVYAAAPADLEEEENASPLEQNFDAAWPKPRDYLPPTGKEPTVQPSDAYAPNPHRENMFESYTFVFLDQAQYETLMPVINAGHGKALLFNVTPGVTTVEKALTYMRNAAGDKGFGDPPDDTNHGGVVMVRYNKVEQQWERWFKDLLDGVSFALDQRSIAQGEFLDAILANEPTRLRRSLEYSSTVEGRVPPSPTAIVATAPPQTSPSQQISSTKADVEPAVRVPSSPTESVTAAHEAPEVTVAPPKKRSRLRGPAIPRIKAFDDEFDADSIPSFVADDDEQSQDGPLQSQSSVADSRYERLPNVKEEKEADRGTSLKRSRPASESEEDMVDELLPAATAMKRRKLEMERRNGGAAQATQAKAIPLPLVKPKKPTKEINVLEAARKRREAEEEAEKRERERDEKALETIEHVKPANLVVIEEMPLRVRPNQPSGANGGTTNDRWDERWNGRQNFKKFRRNGATTVGPRRNVQHVIVPLVEVKKHSYGIGEQYWHHDDNESGSKKKKKTMSQSQGETQSQPRLRGTLQTGTIQAVDDEDHEEEQQHTSPTTTRLQQEAEEIVGAIDVDSPRRTRLGDKTQSSQIARPKKRPAALASGSGAAAPKRQKTIQTRPASDDSDSDDLKFRFRSRNR